MTANLATSLQPLLKQDSFLKDARMITEISDDQFNDALQMLDSLEPSIAHERGLRRHFEANFSNAEWRGALHRFLIHLGGAFSSLDSDDFENQSAAFLNSVRENWDKFVPAGSAITAEDVVARFRAIIKQRPLLHAIAKTETFARKVNNCSELDDFSLSICLAPVFSKDKILGMLPLLCLHIECTDGYGATQSFTTQVHSDAIEDLQQAINQARGQLAVLKVQTEDKNVRASDENK